MRVQAQELAQLTVAATPEPEGFDAGEETALLFIEQAVEENNPHDFLHEAKPI